MVDLLNLLSLIILRLLVQKNLRYHLIELLKSRGRNVVGSRVMQKYGFPVVTRLDLQETSQRQL